MKKLICILFLIFLVTIPSVSADENNTKTEEREEILVIEVPQDNQIDNETNLPEETPDSQKNEKILNVADKQLPEEEKEENLDENNNAYSYNEFENSETIEDSSDTVYLNSTPTKKFNLKKRTKITNQKPVIHQDEDFRVSPQNVDLYRNNDIYSKKTTSFSNEKKFGNLTFGSKHDNTFTMNEYSVTRTLFSKYDINSVPLTKIIACLHLINNSEAHSHSLRNIDLTNIFHYKVFTPEILWTGATKMKLFLLLSHSKMTE